MAIQHGMPTHLKVLACPGCKSLWLRKSAFREESDVVASPFCPCLAFARLRSWPGGLHAAVDRGSDLGTIIGTAAASLTFARRLGLLLQLLDLSLELGVLRRQHLK